MQKVRNERVIEAVKPMNSDQDIDRFLRIFCPGELERLHKIVADARLVYYTRADTAKKIIENREIWFRNAALLNDYSEISYGLRLLTDAVSGPAGEHFGRIASGLFPDAIGSAGELLKPRIPDWHRETYLSCWSLHRPSEDQNGRLSMWRAYGDVALVVRNRAFEAFGDESGMQSLPVNYFSASDCEAQVEQVAENLRRNEASIRSGGSRKFEEDLAHMAFLYGIRTKHPGFAEEEEWRVWFRPTDNPGRKTAFQEKVKVIDGIPQRVWALPLKNAPRKGLHGADIASLLDRIIIGPTAYPYVSYRAFVALLEGAGVRDAAERVIVSEIPLRAAPTAS